MNYNDLENNTVSKYWKTLIRKNISNIDTNKFLKKPYLENYIINLSIILDNNELIKLIFESLENNKISNEELFLFINNNIDFEGDNKKKIERFFLEKDMSDESFNKISVELILYQVKYFRFYQTVTEFLFDGNRESNELYNFILIHITDNKGTIKNYIKKNIKFGIFYYYIKDLYKSYENMFNLLINYEILENNYSKKEIINLFLKNLFFNWYNIYKKDILEDKVNDKIKEHKLKRSIISQILCLPNS